MDRVAISNLQGQESCRILSQVLGKLKVRMPLNDSFLPISRYRHAEDINPHSLRFFRLLTEEVNAYILITPI